MCGREHRPVPLAPGERALCVRCDTVLAQGSRLGPDTALAFTITGLLLAIPAAFQPFITAGKLGNERVGLLFTGVGGLWDNGMHLLAVWVLLCGALVPVALLVTLAGLLLPARFGRPPVQPELLSRAARALGHWAMPEVQVLAVLVALMKLGRLVNVTIGPGFWCYSAMSFALLLAWRSFELQSAAWIPAPVRGGDASPP
jgi:paraquat-inducible protein A